MKVLVWQQITGKQSGHGPTNPPILTEQVTFTIGILHLQIQKPDTTEVGAGNKKASYLEDGRQSHVTVHKPYQKQGISG
jgi:hypothetical protein